MEQVRNWAFSVCAAAIACGIAQMILPKSSMQKIFNVTSSVFFLCCLLSPVIFTPAALDIPSQEQIQQEITERAERLKNTADGQTNSMASETVRLMAQQTLEEMGITARKIYVNVHDDGENGISISECEVELDESLFKRHDEIRAALMDRLGVNVLIGYEKE